MKVLRVLVTTTALLAAGLLVLQWRMKLLFMTAMHSIKTN